MKNLFLVILSAVLVSCGWWELSGLPMLVAFVPLLALADRYDRSRASFWRLFGWISLFFVLWYGATIWWVWFATPAGPVAATFFALLYTGGAFMLWFFVSRRAPKALSYSVFVSSWLVGEWIFNTSQASFPWLALGNGFAHDTWAVQWYEWTGAYGGSAWVLVTSVLVYEFLILRRPRRWLPPALAVLVPIVTSLVIYFSYNEPTQTTKISIIQPNIEPWTEKFDMTREQESANLVELVSRVPADARFVVLPETAVGEQMFIGSLSNSLTLSELRAAAPDSATIVVGATPIKLYGDRKLTHTARGNATTGFYDKFNSVLAISPQGHIDVHNKARMVIGAEMMPTWWWVRGLQNLVAHLDFYAGQYGFGTERKTFTNSGLRAGAGICWESVYGQYFSEFVQNGAQVLMIVTNDGWWRNTPGHRQHFDFARLRAIENRRAIARSANTGRSGFITSRGDVGQTMEWAERGILTEQVPVSLRVTLFTRLGDWPCRLACLVLGSSLLYFIAYRIRRKNHLV